MTGLTYNGYPVVFELSMVTEPGEGWKGSRQLAVCKTVEELSAAIAKAEVPEYWQLEVKLQEDHDRCSGCHECDDD